MLPINNFYGKINGLNAIDYVKQLDYSLKTTEKRLEKVEKILEKPVFFEKYFDNYYKNNKNKEDFLSGDNNVCKSLEKFADYLLLSNDINENIKYENKDWKVEYIFYTDEKLGKNIEKDYRRKVDTIMFLIDKNRNYRKQIKQDIFDKDYLDKDFESEVKIYNINSPDNYTIETVNNLKEYKKMFTILKEIINKINSSSYVLKEGEKPLYQIKKFLRDNIKNSKKELLTYKDKTKNTIYYTNCLQESEDINWFLINFTDQEQVLSLLKIPTSKKIITDLGILVYDLNQLIDQIKFNSFEDEVIELWRRKDWTQQNIANELGVSQQFISATLDNISKKIINQYKDNYEDWIYLNWKKGEYKTCSICKQPKLVSKFHWDITNNCYKSVCKQCIKEKNSCKNP